MSNVHISKGSPTLGRMDARFADNPKPSFCRNLFGPVDHDALKRDFREQLQEMEQAASAEWNFDFKNHQPLPGGRYDWKAEKGNDSPEYYSRPLRDSSVICRSRNNNVDLNGNHNCEMGTPCQAATGDRLSDEKTAESESQMDCRDQCSAQRKRAASREQMSQNKRSHTSSDEVARCPVLTHSVEHTPRKPGPRAQT